MMILSRVWYVILALVAGVAFYVVSLAVGQYNRRNAEAMGETLKSDSQVVSWALQIDSRRRLDSLLLLSVDPSVAKALKTANGKDPIAPSARDDGRKALEAYGSKLPADYRADVLFVADREGRLVAQVGYDGVAGSPQFELGGYPAVFDALHGHLRDDTWVWGGRLARVVARPVEDEVGQPPLGAVVALRWVDQPFVKEIARRTRTNLAFFALGQRGATAVSVEDFEEAQLDAVTQDLPKVLEDKEFKDGRTAVRPLGLADKAGAIYVRLPGDAWELGSGFAVARGRVAISGPMGFLSSADDKDKANVKMWAVALVVIVGAGLGIFFLFLEHSRPLGVFVVQSSKLKAGSIDALELPRFGGTYRSVATNINQGIERVVEKGGGSAKRPANLESILGPVPAQPAMSAFSFPMSGQGDSAVQTAPAAFVPPGAPPSSPSPHRPPHPSQRHAPPTAMGPQGHAPNALGPSAIQPPVGLPDVRPGLGAPPGPPGVVGPAAGRPPGPPPVRPFSPPPMAQGASDDEHEATRVGEPPPGLIAASTGSHSAAEADERGEWLEVYDSFVKTKKQCNETTEGLTFEKFQSTLRKNRDTLVQKHGCKRVKFTVYVKDGKASLKATPVKE